MNKTQKKIIFILYIIYYLLLILATILSIRNNYPNTIIAFIAAFTCFIYPFMFKCFKLKITFHMYIINLLFVFVSNIWGSILDGYSIAYFDKILHFSSGIFITELGFIIYCLFQRNEINSKLCLLFMNAFNMMIAVYWEFIEFGCLIFLKHDAIHHYSSGVFDSMEDMIVASIGGFIVSVFIFLDFKKKNKSIFYKEMIQFMKINHLHTDFFKVSR